MSKYNGCTFIVSMFPAGHLQAVGREEGKGRRRRGARGRPVSREGVDGGGRERGEEGEKGRREGGGREKKPVIRRQAWHEDREETQDKQVCPLQHNVCSIHLIIIHTFSNRQSKCILSEEQSPALLLKGNIYT